MCTFAVSVGFCLGDELYSYRQDAEIILMEGTGVAIDEHYILSSAHIFEWPVDTLGPAPKDLKYRYCYVYHTC
jgi:hypothetical protein